MEGPRLMRIMAVFKMPQGFEAFFEPNALAIYSE